MVIENMTIVLWKKTHGQIYQIPLLDKSLQKKTYKPY
jgi:hypothetical protein